MTFYRLKEIPPRGDELVCRAPATWALIWPIIHAGIGIALLLRGIRGGLIHGLGISTGVFCYGGAAVFGLLGWAALGQLRARTKPSNWLMRCNSSGVLIKYRSFLNWHLPAEHVQVVGFDYFEIAEIRTAREKRHFTNDNPAGYDKYLTYLELRLVNADTSALETRLEAERAAEAPGRFKSRSLDFPVEVLSGGLVRVRWKQSAGYGTTPSLVKVISYLSPYTKTTASVSRNDVKAPRSLTPEEADNRILGMVQTGDKMEAVKCAREIYGCSLSEAVAYVEGLQSKGRAVHDSVRVN
jgi:hypothetical protein